MGRYRGARGPRKGRARPTGRADLEQRIEELESQLKTLGQQALVVMQLELGYHSQIRPRNGHDAIRRWLLWDYAVEAVGGEDEIDYIDDEARATAEGVKKL